MNGIPRPAVVLGGIIHWRCCSCKILMPESQYYKSNRTHNGLKNQCKKCHIQTSIKTRDPEVARRSNVMYMRRARASNPERFRERERNFSRSRDWNNKSEARYALNLAVRRGYVVRPPSCSRCGAQERLAAHHSDYSKPFDVIWLCSTCHGKEHRKNVLPTKQSPSKKIEGAK